MSTSLSPQLSEVAGTAGAGPDDDTSDARSDLFVCPKCVGGLRFDSANGYRCAKCNVDYPMIDGIPIFSRDPEYYFGEMPKEVFVRLLGLARETSAQEALNELLNKGVVSKFAYDYCCARNRGAFFPVLKPAQGRSVLDLGCGWGNVSMTLSRYFERCYSMDLTKERIMFLSQRAKDAGLKNLVGLCGGDMPHLPFPDNSLDCVVLNGVLEWIPESTTQENPEALQIKYLEEVGRALKEDGELYVAIENRYALPYFKGMKEDHTGMLYTSIMPRWLADIVSKIKRGKPYRTYTYSRPGYKKLLERAGFTHNSFYIPFPDYRWYDYFFSVQQTGHQDRYIEETTSAPRWQVELKKKLMRQMPHSFSMVGSRVPNPDGSWLDRFYRHVNETFGRDLGELEYPEVSVSNISGVGCSFRNQAGGGVYVALPVDEVSERDNAAQSESLKTIHETFNCDRERVLCPKALGNGEFLGVKYYSNELIRTVYKKRPDRDKQEGCVLGALREFAQDWTQEDQPPAHLRTRAIVEHGKTYGIDIPDEFESKYERLLIAAGNRRHAAHGDMWIDNVIVDASDKYWIIDWADFRMDGLPLQDLFHLLVFRKVKDSYGLDAACTSFAKGVTERLRESIQAVYGDWGDGYFTHERISALYVLYVLEHVTRRISRGLNQKHLLERLIDIVMAGPFPMHGFKGV